MVAVLANTKQGASPRQTTKRIGNKSRPVVEPLHLPEIPVQHIDAVNALNRRRGPVSFSVVDRVFTLGPVSYPPDIRQDVAVTLTTPHGPATLYVPGVLLDAWQCS